MTAIEAFAPAKINLTLHVVGQRDDGYHLLDSLVAFADIGDAVRVAPAQELTLTIDGPMAGGLEAGPDNLVIKAARLMSPDLGAAITLTKRLPVSSGIGGGSSDAAATLRALSELWNLPVPLSDGVLALGADVPVCLTPQPTRLSGIGETLTAVPGLPPTDILLVNPGVAVATPDVFRRFEHKTNPPMPDAIPAFSDAEGLAAWLAEQRNDLIAPAVAVVPAIADVLAALNETEPLFAAMSGSGATCFALYPPASGHAQASATALSRSHPNWWCAHGRLI